MLVVLALLGGVPSSTRGAPSPLQGERGFEARDELSFDTNRFIGGLVALPGGAVAIYDGSSVVLLEADGSSRTLFTPGEPPVFGSFLRLEPGGERLYFGETRSGNAPHLIHRVPLDPASGEVETVDSIRFNYDLDFDSQGRAFVSALETPPFNRIILLDGDPSIPSDPVVVDIPGFSGPLAFREGRLYYATADFGGANRVVYFTEAQIEAGIGEGREVPFSLAEEEGQVVAPAAPVYFNLCFAGDSLLASDSSGGRIDRIVPGGELEALARVPLPAGGNGWVTFLAFRPGSRAFLPGVGPEGGSVLASITDFTSFNSIAGLIPQLFFRRGRVNDDTETDISDAVALLEFLFLAGPAPDPRVAGDVNDDGQLDVSDPIYLLAHLFSGGSEPPPPFSEEGPDPTP